MTRNTPTNFRSLTQAWGLVLLAAVPMVIGCQSASGPKTSSGIGGSATGGSSDGGCSTGGTMSTGGTTATGGSLASGGVVATGGTIQPSATGGTTMAMGGTVGDGGISAFGGSVGSGGTFVTGGMVGSGGVPGRGGVPGTGGARDAGPDVRPDTGARDSAESDAVPVVDVDPAKKITVWLAGDSTMQNCSSACPCGWGSQFQPYLNANATVVNSGSGGRSIQTWLYDPNVTTTMSNGECVVSPKTYSTRWQDMLDGMKAGDYLFVEFGINDSDSTCNRHVGTALFQSYLETMADAAKTRGAQPIFLTSTSAIACSGTTAQANRGFGPETKAAGKAAGVPVIDLTVLSAAFYTSLGLCPNSSDYTSTTSAVGKFFCDDHTHFETAGATQIAGVVAKALRDQGIGLAAYLK